MLAASSRDLIKRGITAARQGDKTTARSLLSAATAESPESELAWLWLASVAHDREETVACLERALAINPEDERTRIWLDRVRVPKIKTRRHFRCPFCHGEALVEIEKCPSCRAVVQLKSIDLAINNTDVDHEMLRAALSHLESLTGKEVTFEVHLHIALAYLNLKRTYEGLTRLRVALQLAPSAADLAAAISQLEARMESAARASAHLHRSAASEAPTKRVVLVVDDSPTVLKLVGVTLERQGHEVLVASNALQALAKLDEVTPNLLLVDISMPHMDGYQLAKLIRGNPATAGVPIVMLSGRDGFFDRMRGRLAGANDHISKPFDPATLVAAIERHCPREAGADGG